MPVLSLTFNVPVAGEENASMVPVAGVVRLDETVYVNVEPDAVNSVLFPLYPSGSAPLIAIT